MKKITLIIFLALASCSTPEPPAEICKCRFDAIRYLTNDGGANWGFNGYDGRHGMLLECSLERTIIQWDNENTGVKTVFKCR